MSNTKTASKKSTTKAANELTKKNEKDELAKQIAEMAINPHVVNAGAAEFYTKHMFGEVDLWKLTGEIKKTSKAINEGDLTSVEAMLIGQAQALQSMFASLARSSTNQEYLKPKIAHMNLAFKAQAQSRATIQALIELKYPRQVVIANQANIANQQQVNNGEAKPRELKTIHAHEEKNKNNQNELLENQSAEVLTQQVPSSNEPVVIRRVVSNSKGTS